MNPAEEWQTSPDTDRLSALLGKRLTLSRARLILVGYCRHRGIGIAPHEAEFLALLEDVANGTKLESQLPGFERRSRSALPGMVHAAMIHDVVAAEGQRPSWQLDLAASIRNFDVERAFGLAMAAAGPSPPDVHVNHEWHRVFQSAYYAYSKPKADLFRCVSCNPFRPVALDPAWRTDTAVSLARGMYESRDFSAMPILADALQDADCDNDDILTHCRGAGPHVRGCWVVDLVLDKS